MSGKQKTSEHLYPFVLTEEQEHLRKEIRAFAAQEIAPNVMKWDENSEFPQAMVKKLGTMGLLGIIFPHEYEGAGLGYVVSTVLDRYKLIKVPVDVYQVNHVPFTVLPRDFILVPQ